MLLSCYVVVLLFHCVTQGCMSNLERFTKPCIKEILLSALRNQPTVLRLHFPKFTDRFTWKGFVTVGGRRIFGVVFPILKGRQLGIYCSDSEWSFSKRRIVLCRFLPSPKLRPLCSGLYNCAIMALTFADRGEKLQSETLLLYFCWTFSLFRPV